MGQGGPWLMGWTERNDGTQAAAELSGAAGFATIRFSGERHFIITSDMPADAVVSYPESILGGPDGATPLPSIGSAHPRFPGAVLRYYTAVCDPPNVHLRAHYTYGDIDPVNPEFFGQSGDFFDESDEIPYAEKRSAIVSMGDIPPGGGPPQVVSIDVWRWGDSEVPPRRVIYNSRQHTMSVNVGGLIGDAIAAMDEQNNAIHKINGRYYRFKAGTYSEVREDVWVVNYHWFYDSGTFYDSSLDAFLATDSRTAIPNPITGGAGPSAEHPGARPEFGRTGVQYIRLPYHKRLIAPNPSGDPSDRPLFPHFMPYRVDEDGWQNLVGL